jgi:hypothetical protein
MTRDRRNPAFPRMMSAYCRQRGAALLSPREVELLRTYVIDCFHRAALPPKRGKGFGWRAIAQEAGLEGEAMLAAAPAFRSGFEALEREIRKAPHPTTDRLGKAPARAREKPAPPLGRPAFVIPPNPALAAPSTPRQAEDEPFNDFHTELDRHMRMHGDTPTKLRRALQADGLWIEASTLRMWRLGIKSPLHKESLDILRWLEARYGLPSGHFRPRLPNASFATRGQRIAGIEAAERRRLAWHLPDDFHLRTASEQEEILEWVQRVVVSGATDYRLYQAAAMKHRFALQFPTLQVSANGALLGDNHRRSRKDTTHAPAQLVEEMAALMAYKTTTLAPRGYVRRGVWGPETASQKLEHFGLFFGALAASPSGPIRGRGLPLGQLTCALLVLPQVWDWYLHWREQRRGFFTAWEADMLLIAGALTGEEAGWLTQTPALAEKLHPIDGLVTEAEVADVQRDWPAACARLHRFALARTKEISRVAKVHHDPFEPILPVLEAASPVGEYRKIADEIRYWSPCSQRYPKAAAESARAYLMIRFGLHLGFRQKNLRELLFCPPGSPARSERTLSDARKGELRWSERDASWEVFVPASAFKNAGSTFFGGRPFRLLLPDIDGLHAHIEQYLTRHRQLLLGPAADPGTFFVKTSKARSVHAAYGQNTFYEAWRWIIQRYGIYNPFTGRGAIAGLLPHGPHSVRDIIATHVLKQTGSYEQASYAIQDTPETVAQHYGRFLPQDKAAMAAEVLNRAWAES